MCILGVAIVVGSQDSYNRDGVTGRNSFLSGVEKCALSIADQKSLGVIVIPVTQVVVGS